MAKRLDILKEVFNIGAGGAANALGALIGDRVMIDVPEIYRLSPPEVVQVIGKMDGRVYSLVTDISGQYAHRLLMMFSESAAMTLVGITENRSGKKLEGSLRDSFFVEIANIMSSHFTNNIAKILAVRLLPDMPQFCIDTQALALERICSSSSELMLVKTDIFSSDSTVNINFLFATEGSFIDLLLEKLS